MIDRLFIDGERLPGEAAAFASHDPATGEAVWEGQAASPQQVDAAVSSARGAFSSWALTPVGQRLAMLERYRDIVRRDADDLARLISRENGKPFWEAKTEAAAVAAKVDLSVKAYRERTGEQETASGATKGMLRHKPHGIMAVLAPFNFPAHLANGHIVPALIAGNTVVVKPSEQTPSPLSFLIDRFVEAGLPSGVINLVQGAREVGEALVSHRDVNGVLFTGGVPAGRAIARQLADSPEKILALELGGNNPLIWWDTEDDEAAAYAVVQSAFLTAGQRCTCARRLFVPDGPRGEEAIDRLITMTSRIRVGAAFDEPQPFMGPLINAQAAEAVRMAINRREAGGAETLFEMPVAADSDAFQGPAIVDVTNVSDLPDEECFGPMLQVIRVPDFDAAIAGANDTRFGLSAGLFSHDNSKWEKFLALSRAGIVNWNRQTTGASGSAPFGGIGLSGNHRPSAWYAADYCAYPVASMEGEGLLSVPDDAVGITS